MTEYTPEQAAALLKSTVKRVMKIWRPPTVGEMVKKLQALPQDLPVHVGSSCVYPSGTPKLSPLWLEKDKDGRPDFTKPATAAVTIVAADAE